MRAKKWLTIITLTCSVISVVLAISFSKLSNCIWYDYSMAVFGSALLGLIMSFTEYLVERQRAMEVFLTESRKVLTKLRKIKYLDSDAPLEKIIACFEEEQWHEAFKPTIEVATIPSSKEEHHNRDDLIAWFKKNTRELTSLDDNQLITYYESAMKKYRQNFQEVIDSCFAAATIDLGELDKAYGNLDFFLNYDIRNKLAYQKIYLKIRECRDWARKMEGQFQSLKDGKGNFAECIKSAKDICDKVFEVKEFSKGNHNTKNVFQTIFDDIEDALDDFWCQTYHKKQDENQPRFPVNTIMHTYLEESDSHGED